MIQNLSDDEKKILKIYKEEYDKKCSNSLGYIQSKLNKVEDTLTSLQSKGYLEVKRENIDDNQEFVNMILKTKFFEYFNINLCE